MLVIIPIPQSKGLRNDEYCNQDFLGVIFLDWGCWLGEKQAHTSRGTALRLTNKMENNNNNNNNNNRKRVLHPHYSPLRFFLVRIVKCMCCSTQSTRASQGPCLHTFNTNLTCEGTMLIRSLFDSAPLFEKDPSDWNRYMDFNSLLIISISEELSWLNHVLQGSNLWLKTCYIYIYIYITMNPGLKNVSICSQQENCQISL